MSILRTRRVSLRLFFWDRQANKLVAEISDLGTGFRFERVYDDACDVGFSVESHRTGRAVTYAIDHEQRDADGDVQWWDLVPAAGAACSSLPPIRLFND